MPVTSLQLDQNVLLAQAQADKIWKEFMVSHLGFDPKEVEYGERENLQAGQELQLVEPSG